MKTYLLPILYIFIFSSVNAGSNSTIVLETREKSATYISKQQLNNATAAPLINSIKQITSYNSVQVNVDVDGNNIIRDAANEPSIAVNPLNPDQIVIGWRQFNSVFNSFRHAGKSYSDDGGVSWNFQPVFEPGVFRSDPVLAANADGRFYYQSLGVEFDNQGNATSFKVDQWTSIDGGITWTDKTFVFGGDKSWIAIDKTDGNTRGNIYAAWNIAGNEYAPNTFNSSLNNGISYTQPITIPQTPIFGTIDVAANGDLYILGIDGNGNGFEDIYLIKSTNPGVLSPLFPQITSIDLGGPSVLGSAINPVGLNGQLYVKIDKSNRASNGNVYVMGSINPDGFDPLDINFARSTDGGVTFSLAKRINTDNTNDWQWFGTMSVAPNGRIDIIWNDTRNDDGSNNTTDITSRLFYTYSYDAGMTFAKEQAVTPRFNHTQGYPQQNKMGDYIDMVSDNRGAHIAYTATFNNEQDVYYLFAKPSAIEENPDFPTILTNNAWAVAGAPSQGILSTTLINNANPDSSLLAFEAIFTAKPDGTPIWLVATGKVPITGDSYTVPLFMPTGDLSDEGEPLLAIGTMTKSRLKDAEGELIDNKINYKFDMSDAVKEQLAATLETTYDETFFDNNPFNNIQKNLVFDSLLPRQQLREDLCNINGQVLTSTNEKNEGRVQYTYRRNGIIELFGADFTYKKTVNVEGVAAIDLDDNSRATPIWEVFQANSLGVLADNSVKNIVFTPNGGLGFFEQGENTGIKEIGTEQVTVNGEELTTNKPNKVVEIMSVLANNAYCGAL